MLKSTDDTFFYLSLILRSNAKVKPPKPPLDTIPYLKYTQISIFTD